MARLGAEERGRFAEDGYLVIPDLVPVKRRAIALRAINNWLVNGFDPEKLAVYEEQSYAPELQRSDAVIGLYRDTPVRAYAESLVGQPLLSPDTGQVALRFPAPPTVEVDSEVVGGHIDGLPSPNNAVPNDGRVYAFTLLAGVFLSDMTDPGNANFTVWPGSHHDMARWFQAHGTTIDDPDAVYAENARLCAARPAMPLLGKAGDVVFAHHLLVHNVGYHDGPHIRYAVFFRLRVQPWDVRDDRVLTDPFHEYIDVPGASGDYSAEH